MALRSGFSSDADLAFDLRRVSSALRRTLRAQTDAGDLKPSQTAVLLRLERDGPTTTSSLARAEGMRPQSMRSIVAALDSAGLVSGAPDPGDGRQTILSLTDGCRAWLEAGRAARQDWLAAAVRDRLTPDERDRLEEALDLIRRLLDERVADRSPPRIQL